MSVNRPMSKGGNQGKRLNQSVKPSKDSKIYDLIASHFIRDVRRESYNSKMQTKHNLHDVLNISGLASHKFIQNFNNNNPN